MKTLTIFARSSGCGRSTAAFALAGVWLHLGYRVGVIDLTHERQQITPSSTIRRWSESMFDGGIRRSQLRIARATTTENLDELLASMIMGGVKRVVIDTAAKPDPVIDHALMRSQLVLCPLPGAIQARRTAEHLDRMRAPPGAVHGIMSRMEGEARAQEREEMSEAFGRPFLMSELDTSELIGSLLNQRQFLDLLGNLIGRRRPVDADGRAVPAQLVDRPALARDWRRLLMLAAEVECVLSGFKLTRL